MAEDEAEDVSQRGIESPGVLRPDSSVTSFALSSKVMEEPALSGPRAGLEKNT